MRMMWRRLWHRKSHSEIIMDKGYTVHGTRYTVHGGFAAVIAGVFPSLRACFRHCERSEAIYTYFLDYFTALQLAAMPTPLL